MDTERAWCVVRRAADGAGYEVRFGCDDANAFVELVRALKQRVPAPDRCFDPYEKWWTVRARGRQAFAAWLRDRVAADQRRYEGVDPEELFAPERRPPPPPPPSPRGAPSGGSSPYDVLMLRPGAPPALVKAAYRVLAQLHHPDRGGTTAVMQRLNAAYEALGKGAA